jgi:arylsulfatase
LDTGLPVSNDYASPNSFPGTAKKVEIHLEPVTMNRTDIEQIRRSKKHRTSRHSNPAKSW